jgi:hypothetical protein
LNSPTFSRDLLKVISTISVAVIILSSKGLGLVEIIVGLSDEDTVCGEGDGEGEGKIAIRFFRIKTIMLSITIINIMILIFFIDIKSLTATN